MMTTTHTFSDQVDSWVRQAILDGASSFDELVCSLPGVYPVDAAASLDRCGESLSAAKSRVGPRRSNSIKTDASITSSQQSDWLPIPHPLDYDWRFEPSAIECLLASASNADKRFTQCCILGAPSIVPDFVSRFDSCLLHVFDANPLVSDGVSKRFPNVIVSNVDLVVDEPVSRSEAELVITDPPWYVDHMKAFLWSASRLCRPGGLVLASFPGLGTRPGADDERHILLSYAREIGLFLKQVEPAALRYASPNFEQNALRAANCVNVPINWRAGDLVIFECQRNAGAEQRPFSAASQDNWTEVCVRGVRLKVKTSTVDKCGDPQLRSVVSGDILDTVSRRDTRISRVDVWTMGNRVFGCSAPGSFLKLAKALNSGELGDLLKQNQGSSEFQNAVIQLERLIDAELAAA